MEILYASCCGLEVHKDSITACLRRLESTGQVPQLLRTFGTTPGALLPRLDWLVAAGCTHVAMESTGPYWKPGGEPVAPGGPRRGRVGRQPHEGLPRGAVPPPRPAPGEEEGGRGRGPQSPGDCLPYPEGGPHVS
jgi:hypothetical protein